MKIILATLSPIVIILIPIIIIYFYKKLKQKAKVREEDRIERVHNKKMQNWQALIDSEPESTASSENR